MPRLPEIPQMQDCFLIHAKGQAAVTVPTGKLNSVREMMDAAGYATDQGTEISKDEKTLGSMFIIMYDPDQEALFLEHLQTTCQRNNLTLKTEVHQPPIPEAD